MLNLQKIKIVIIFGAISLISKLRSMCSKGEGRYDKTLYIKVTK
jgi:hypothetical protein